LASNRLRVCDALAVGDFGFEDGAGIIFPVVLPNPNGTFRAPVGDGGGRLNDGKSNENGDPDRALLPPPPALLPAALPVPTDFGLSAANRLAIAVIV
jgi:hypothetical protein